MKDIFINSENNRNVLKGSKILKYFNSLYKVSNTNRYSIIYDFATIVDFQTVKNGNVLTTTGKNIINTSLILIYMRCTISIRI